MGRNGRGVVVGGAVGRGFCFCTAGAFAQQTSPSLQAATFDITPFVQKALNRSEVQ